MRFETKYNNQDKVLFKSEDIGENLSGTIVSIDISSNEIDTEIEYTIIADKEIKSSFIHIINESEIIKIL